MLQFLRALTATLNCLHNAKTRHINPSTISSGPRLRNPGRHSNNPIMPDENPKSHPGRADVAISLAPLTPDQALAAALRVKPEDVKKLEEAEKRDGRRQRKNG